MLCLSYTQFYEDGDEVVVNGCRLREIWRENSDIGVSDDPDPADAPMMWEWRFNLTTGGVSEKQIDDQGSEFPRVPDHLVGLTNRYGYTVTMGPGSDGTGGSIYKYDLSNGGTRTEHTFPCWPLSWRAIVCSSGRRRNEDDGYLMTYVYAGDTNTSYLVLLDASNVAADPVAEIPYLDECQQVFHGSWIAD